EGARFECDVLAETLARSSLGAKTAGAPVNLERALRVGDRVGGHFVAGHVDGTGRVAAVERAGSDWALRVVCDGMLTREMVPKGSVACDGVSLTVTALDADGFTVHVIPFTWTHTTLGRLGTGAAVNIETDMIGKYVRRMLARQGDAGGVDRALLERAGFV
ncbi:MAG: riboflavin synthase, partial [Lentisphaerae bacterium]|nr:riboflavin synthase [Lentisphaerota bacterium]